jgi:hypothetical protein
MCINGHVARPTHELALDRLAERVKDRQTRATIQGKTRHSHKTRQPQDKTIT